MVTLTRNVSGTDIIPILRDLEFDYAELSMSHLCEMSDYEMLEVKSVLTGTGLHAEACNNFFPADLHLTGPGVDRSKLFRHLDKSFQICGDLGVKTIVFGSGPARNVPGGFYFHEAIQQLAELLKLINDYAVKQGITIAIEPLRRQECNVINTYKEALDLAKMTDASNVGCLLDFFHLSEEKEDISVIHTGKSCPCHIHISNPFGRSFPSKSDKAIFHEYMTSILKAGYDGRISIEAYSVNFMEEARESLQLLKDIEHELKNN